MRGHFCPTLHQVKTLFGWKLSDGWLYPFKSQLRMDNLTSGSNFRILNMIISVRAFRISKNVWSNKRSTIIFSNLYILFLHFYQTVQNFCEVQHLSVECVVSQIHRSLLINYVIHLGGLIIHTTPKLKTYVAIWFSPLPLPLSCMFLFINKFGF